MGQAGLIACLPFIFIDRSENTRYVLIRTIQVRHCFQGDPKIQRILLDLSYGSLIS